MSRQAITELDDEGRRCKIITALIAQRRVIHRRPGTTLDDLIADYESDHRIVQCSIGTWHAVFVNRQGQVYFCGRNYNGELGCSDREKHATVPEPASFSVPSGVKQAIADNGFSLFVSHEGEVYICGRGAHHILGSLVGDMSKGLVKVPVPFDYLIDSVAVGEEHILLLTKEGRVFGYGLNQDGELGLGGAKLGSVLEEVSVAPDVSIKAIATGCEHSVFLTTTGDVYACGNQYFGSLGLGYRTFNTRRETAKPHKVELENGETYKAITASGRQTQLVTTNGKVYCCGTVLTKPHLPVIVPTPLFDGRREESLLMPPIDHAVAGDDNTLYIANDGRVFISGYGGRREELKIGFTLPAEIKLLEHVKAVDVFIGVGRRMAIVTDDGSVCLSADACKKLGIATAPFPSFSFSSMFVIDRGAFELSVAADTHASMRPM
ncbi:MAG: hypothetical protein P1U34_04955 [Coxiellaceae bacterium]|nr:hypothetical protein [Coxiellaceae bacterium]